MPAMEHMIPREARASGMNMSLAWPPRAAAAAAGSVEAIAMEAIIAPQ